MHIKHIHETIEKISEYACKEACKSVEEIDTKELGEAVDMIKDLSEAEYYARISKAMEESDKEDEEEAKRLMKELKEEYGEEEGERRFYRGQPRSRTTGRYMRRGDGRRNNGGRRSYMEMMMPEMYDYDDEFYRDIDREKLGRLYYSGGGRGGNSMGGNSGNRSGEGNSNSSRNYEDGYSEGNRRGYEEGYERGRSESGNSNSRYDRAKRGYEEKKEMHKGNTAEDNAENMRGLEEILSVVGGDVKELMPKMSASEKAMASQKFDSWSKMMKQ